MKPENRGYDKDLFIISTEKKEIALIPGLGKFCACNCGKQIKGTKVTRKVNGNLQTYYLPPLETKIYATQYCKRRVEYQRRTLTGKTNNNIIKASVSLRLEDANTPYRILKLFINKNHHVKIKLTPKNKELWKTLDKIAHYRQAKINEKIKPMNILSQVVQT